MSHQDLRILVASLIEVRELYAELYGKLQLNNADRIAPHIYDRAERATTARYYDRNNPGTPPHQS